LHPNCGFEPGTTTTLERQDDGSAGRIQGLPIRVASGLFASTNEWPDKDALNSAARSYAIGAALPGRLTWQLGMVAELVPETLRATSIVLELPGWPGHRAGQHVDVRLTAEDGYQAWRSYSIASAPEDGYVVLTVERVPGGEVSPYLAGELRTGDQLELRGPIGGYFVWDDFAREPVLLVAGGSGIVPFRSMLRHRQAAPGDVAVRLLYSARSLQDVIYRDELMHFAAYDEVDIRFALTREWPESWHGHRGRIDGRLLSEVSWPAGDRPRTFICGPTPFVETAASTLAAQGQPSDRIKTERFGGSRMRCV
jgi:ferredoxin-NADP reductase